jgi:hypothetical protein
MFSSLSMNRLNRSILHAIVTIIVGLSASSCNIYEEYSVQSGIFECDSDSQCPQDFFCDNYFNTYVYYVDVRAQPAGNGRWGFCNSQSELVKNSEFKSVEDCFNGRDEDEDGEADCLDLECQTAPACRDWIAEACPAGDVSETCTRRLGFPFIRNDAAADETTCPAAVGVIYTDDAGAGTFCLPRCRLYFPRESSQIHNSEEIDFQGSDDYCNAVVPMYGTHAAFTGAGSLRCQHVGVVENDANIDIQQDVCLPDAPDMVLASPEFFPPEDTCESVCGVSSCLKISTRRRIWSMVSTSSPNEDIQMITQESEGNDPDIYLETAYYCLD